MSNNTAFAVAGLLVALASGAHAADELTLKDMSVLAMQAKAAELRAKAEPAAAVAAPASSSASPLLPPPGVTVGGLPSLSANKIIDRMSDDTEVTSEIRLQAVYGRGSNLTAEVLYNNRLVIASLSGNKHIGPWEVSEITPYKVTLSRPADKSRATRALYMAGGGDSVELHTSPTSGAPSQHGGQLPFGATPGIPGGFSGLPR